jgi:hypothetical protein
MEMQEGEESRFVVRIYTHCEIFMYFFADNGVLQWHCCKAGLLQGGLS